MGKVPVSETMFGFLNSSLIIKLIAETTDCGRLFFATIVTGDSLSKLFMDEKHIFPAQLAQLTAVGENTGNMEEMFQSISNYYEEEFDTVVKGLSTIIEPLMIVIIGAIIGILMVALYMPIFSIGQTIR